MVPDLGEFILAISPPEESAITWPAAPHCGSIFFTCLVSSWPGPLRPSSLVKVDVLFAFQLWSRHSDVIRNCASWKGFSKTAALGDLSTPRSSYCHMCSFCCSLQGTFNDHFHRVTQIPWGAQATEGKSWFSAIYILSKLEWHFMEKPKAIVSRY